MPYAHSIRPLCFATFYLLVLTIITSCDCKTDNRQEQPAPQQSAPAVTLTSIQKALNTNADIAYALYSDAYDTAIALQDALKYFAQTPSQDAFDQAKRAWLIAREPYGQTEVYRFRLSPIDSTNYKDEDGPEGAINAWPLGEALIDYVQEGTDFGAAQLGITEHQTNIPYPAKNLINSSVPITAELLALSTSASDERDVISGYHAIEFMLWGQDLNRDGSADTQGKRDLSTSGRLPNSGGQRPLTDFTTSPFAKRRHQYLQLITKKLVEDLRQVVDAWAPGAQYRLAFTSVNTKTQALEKLTEIFTGMGTLSEGELAGERLQIAYTSSSQEDEHSCFSDNTHRDVWLNAKGVANSYYGQYHGYDSTLDGNANQTQRAISGYGISDLIQEVGLFEISNKLESALAVTTTNANALDNLARSGKPFDVLIMGPHRKKADPIYNLILSLNEQSRLLGQLAKILNLQADVVIDDASSCNASTPLSTCE